MILKRLILLLSILIICSSCTKATPQIVTIEKIVEIEKPIYIDWPTCNMVILDYYIYYDAETSYYRLTYNSLKNLEANIVQSLECNNMFKQWFIDFCSNHECISNN